MTKNPETITVSTPDDTITVKDVATWWRNGPDLMVEKGDGREVCFPLGEVLP